MLKMVLPTVLKWKHTLKEKQLLPVIRKLRDFQDAHGIKQLIRTSSARRTKNMSNEDVLKVVEDLTSENEIELLELSGVIIYNIIKLCLDEYEVNDITM